MGNSLKEIIGPTGPTGATGATGEGVPTGGTEGQLLAKNSATNYDTEWIDAGGWVLSDTYANRPAAGTEGRLFLPTNGYYPTRDTGAAWVVQNPLGYDCTDPPAAASLTAVNQNYSTLVDDGDGLLFTLMGSASTAETEEVYVTAVPGGAYVFTVGLEIQTLWPSNTAAMGICLTNGTTTAAEIVSFAVVTGLTTSTGLYAQKFTNFAYTATYLNNIQAFTFPSVLFLRITDDTTNRIMDFQEMAGIGIDSTVWDAQTL